MAGLRLVFLILLLGLFSHGFLATPSEEKDQADARTDGTIGYIEGGETDSRTASLFYIKIKKVNHVLGPQAVDEISNDASKD